MHINTYYVDELPDVRLFLTVIIKLCLCYGKRRQNKNEKKFLWDWEDMNCIFLKWYLYTIIFVEEKINL